MSDESRVPTLIPLNRESTPKRSRKDSEAIPYNDMDTNAATKVSIVLKSRDDWRAWYDNIQSLAKARDIWEYINLDTKKEELPGILKELEIPDIEKLLEPQWKIYMQLWMAKINKYEKIKRGLAVVNEAIRGLISTLLIYHIYGKELVYDILKALKV
ncbi:hypothetical protein BJY01DRAFT_255931 [Aspergillus pseudoustus]|uniref:DUF4219 domain-containing protein n=1 Tax=Aspergillus pseudoustus TaxID=1810923 RepID=A0ABR4IFS3_9EURO